MRVLRIEVEVPVCSFRYPHFLVGRQLSFDMPPPSTIYGHIASALGEWPEPVGLQFAYHFTTSGKGEDLEHQHLVVPSHGRFESEGQRYPKALDVTIQPTKREFLLGVRMTLYLNRLDLADAFENPAFPVVLGRSQDLACYTRVEEVELQRTERGYFEATLLPFAFRKRTARGITVLMPRYIGQPPLREPMFDRYILLKERVFCVPPGEGEAFGSTTMIQSEAEPVELWVDPHSPEHKGMRRALYFNSFVDASRE